MCAQTAHASMKIWFDRMEKLNDGNYKTKDLTPEMVEWKESAFTKVVVSVDSEEEIYALAEKS